MISDICTLSAVEMARQIRAKQLSAREVVSAHLDQIARVNPAVNAIVTGAHTIPDEAMPAAVTKIGHAIVNLSPTQDKAPLLSKLHTGTPFDGATELITSDKEEPGAVVTGSPTMAANPTAHTGGTVNTGAMHPLNQRGPLSGVNTASMKSLGARRVGGYSRHHMCGHDR